MEKSYTGVLQLLPKGGAFLRDPSISFHPSSDDVWISKEMMREHDLISGAMVTGTADKGDRGWFLKEIDDICGLSPEGFKERTRFERLVAIDPNERIPLGAGGNISMRIIDLIAPIGKGTRGLIVAPPKAGKTQLLEEIATSLHEWDPDTRVIMMLVDERPEEVTHFRRNTQAQVLASSSDQPLESHISLVELVLAHIRCELECGRNVVVLVDSITRMARAFNLRGAGARRTRFFGIARNVENGGSVTVIATALIETGSRMDDYIFEEFKSTGNSEIVLDRSLAESRIYPAINIFASGTRKEELLYSEDEMQRLITLRRWLSGGKNKAAMEGLLKFMGMAENNEELLQKLNPAS